MFCTQCGNVLAEGARFCANCGAPAACPQQAEPAAAAEPPAAQPQAGASASQPDPAPPKKGRKGTALGILLGAVAATAVCVALAFAVGILPVGNEPAQSAEEARPGAAAGNEQPEGPAEDPPAERVEIGRVEGPGFASPGEAAAAYLKALRAGDMDGMLAAFAMESYVERADLEAYLEHLQVYVPNAPVPVPGDGAYLQRLSLERRRGDLAQSIFYQYVYLTAPDSPILAGMPVMVEESAGALMRQLEVPDGTRALAGLEIGAVLAPGELTESYGAPGAAESREKQAAACGADEFGAAAVEVRVDGETYLFCPDAVRYGDRWYLQHPCGTLAAMLGAPTYAGGFVSAW